mmetsp:Transcript_2706/g.6343  ORF Transcript_2706/g.6343 Transcript_2706/m.6343 type:complete len:678 (-) Transcript_2706:641-2674(-)|eukprot:CAMPEP_0171568306 /NCGR_PEP_ID=MMETSP0961-20121227/1681_1 /TAXON_ID=87120 /ORGANISM="Aurantiochytrium limacinum, Strain ATCCMYA-1381" /LENGTH=677 /DNA_ID=CAMNT_0012122401 /DNA_START=711 /DNA_END=2744 /DNA_ORIENTATION=-
MSSTRRLHRDDYNQDIEQARSLRNAGTTSSTSGNQSTSTRGGGMTMFEFLKLCAAGVLAGFVCVQLLEYFAPTIVTVSTPSLDAYDQQTEFQAGEASGSSDSNLDFQKNWSPSSGEGSTQDEDSMLAPTMSPVPICIHSKEDPYLPTWATKADHFVKEPFSSIPNGRFYIYEEGSAIDANLIVQCLFSVLEVPLPEEGNELDLKSLLMNTNVHENQNFRYALTDIALLDGLKRHPNRVTKVEDADFIIPSLLPYVSYELPDSSLLQDYCPFLTDAQLTHTDRMISAMDALNKFPMWADKSLRGRFMVIHSRPYGEVGCRDSIPPELFQQLVLGNVYFLMSSEIFMPKQFKKQLRKKARKSSSVNQAVLNKAITVPLLPNPYIKFDVSKDEIMDRSTQFFFEEVFPDSSTIKSLKTIGFQLTESRSRISGRNHPSGLIDARKQHAFNMEHSENCFVMRRGNDHPFIEGIATLYDAIRAGCVPILLFDDIPLPFRLQLDWKAISYLTAGVSCFSDRLSEIHTLETMTLDPQNKMQIRKSLREAAPLFNFQETIVDPRVSLSDTSPSKSSGSPSGSSSSSSNNDQDSSPSTSFDENGEGEAVGSSSSGGGGGGGEYDSGGGPAGEGDSNEGFDTFNSDSDGSSDGSGSRRILNTPSNKNVVAGVINGILREALLIQNLPA